MLDTWSEPNAAADFDRPADTKRGPALVALVERALERELASRRQLRPHAQLSIAPDATAAAVDEAYARMAGRYDARAFCEYGDAAVATALQIAELLRLARDEMRRRAVEPGSPIVELPRLEARPRRDETLRALETLRGAIMRRLAEADEHRRAGRARDAIRCYEFVLNLERHNDHALQALAALLPEAMPARRGWWRRCVELIRRRRRAAGAARDAAAPDPSRAATPTSAAAPATAPTAAAGR